MEMVYMMRMMSMKCNETICTFEEWTSSAEGYFSIDKNGDVQILHMMEWKDYNESKKR